MSNFEAGNFDSAKWFVDSKGKQRPNIKTWTNQLGQKSATLINHLAGKRRPTNVSLTVGEKSVVIGIVQGKQRLVCFVRKDLLKAMLE